ncbi:host cell division inhibitor Icd-like protein [Salmonella enterica subsp. enterica serovar Worthington]|nr:host cell division inhibitor Icd-like protein [Salmonella enterica subsp. enterica serovar Worthington]ECS8707827.1 host cell division inhibitor Icd-like protein [Salmonella enterica subsp. enterica serovar Worthington]EDT7900259.1 host cell division inhibitor Icd-like protein [Salmonella enterica subsp. enterica serovar Worthington]EDU4011290.1 host cell division inhibitor Icd-like protein [Salmonella enterica subsp. enterica serovar Worthington]EDU4595393.1 host cell division inhibitor Icd
MILHNSIRVAQNLSRRNSHAQIKLGDMPSLNNRVRLTYGHRNPLNHLNYREMRELASNEHEKYSGSWQNNVKRGSEVPTNNVESCEDNHPSLRGEAQRLCGSLRPAQNLQVTKSHSQNDPSLRGAVHSITESNPVQLSDSNLAFLRWRRLISPRIAVTINPALLSPSSLSDSISATTSCGTRTVKSCDFAFLLDVAITDSFDVWCVSVYAKKSYAQCLKCVSLECSFKSEGETHLTNSEARQCSNTNRASYHNVTEAYIMACIQHTQTRPKYQYRFLALSAIGRNVIHITATTEREAREQSPAGCVMVFAGRLPVEVRHA